MGGLVGKKKRMNGLGSEPHTQVLTRENIALKNKQTNNLYYYFMCMAISCVYACIWCPCRPEESIGPSGAGFTVVSHHVNSVDQIWSSGGIDQCS